jgi:hypothetical protein
MALQLTVPIDLCAKHYLRLDPIERQEPVKHGGSLPAGGRKGQEISLKQCVQQISYPARGGVALLGRTLSNFSGAHKPQRAIQRQLSKDNRNYYNPPCHPQD